MVAAIDPQSLSLSKAVWDLPDTDYEAVQRLVNKYDLPEFIARLLCVRGIEENSVESFLRPTFKNDMPSPFLLAGMDACANDIAKAIVDGEKIAIFGDFDVDGATSSAVLYRFLKHCGVDAPIYIPERLTEGYGPNIQALKKIKDSGANILMMLDCGSGSHDVIQQGQDLGLKITIIDHHEVGAKNSPAWHLINPKRLDDKSGLDMLAAVGVTFFTCVAINSKLRELSFYSKNNIKEANLMSLVDLVGLGTVCDVVPLVHVNRLLVQQGFKRMNAMKNVGLCALAKVSAIEPPFSPYHAGYILGPRVNAGSRVGKSKLGAELFTIDNSEAAMNIAWQLNDCKEQRKDMQASMESEAIALAEKSSSIDDAPYAMIIHEGWHSGLTGLVAGRIKEHFKKPAIIGCIEDGLVKGSGRSVEGIHIGHVFVQAMEQGLIHKGGGHAMAGGFSCAVEQLDVFESFVTTAIAKQIGGKMPLVSHKIDSVISVTGSRNVEQIKQLHEQVGPFGAEFEEPLFLLKKIKIHHADILGGSHLKLMISDQEGGTRMKVMAFKAAQSGWTRDLIKHEGRIFDLIGQLKINSWHGRESVELHLRDARLSH